MSEKPEEYPCAICGEPITWAELCKECAKGNDPFGPDLEGPGGGFVQDYHASRMEAHR